MTITATSELHDAWARWHAAREADLAADHGWLSLTGFHWLPRHRNYSGRPARAAGRPVTAEPS